MINPNGYEVLHGNWFTSPDVRWLSSTSAPRKYLRAERRKHRTPSAAGRCYSEKRGRWVFTEVTFDQLPKEVRAKAR